MEQGYNIGIIGAGPAGCTCAYFLLKNGLKNISLIDFANPMRTILPTGGGRCNLANAEYDFRELVKNYPRGEKFLYSIFSRFSTTDTISFFEELGIETYIQSDNRIFPTSNSSLEVQEKLLKSIKGCKFIKEKCLRIETVDSGFKVVTDMNSYRYDKLVIATGGHSGLEIIKRLNISTVAQKPSLVGLVTKEKFSDIMGTVIENVFNKDTKYSGSLLFTHFGLSAPLVYKISSIYARREFPYKLSFDLCPNLADLQKILNENPHKIIKNVLCEYFSNKFAEYLLKKLEINPETKSHMINGKTRDLISDYIHNFEVNVLSTKKDGETVSSGGVCLEKINSKTMESKEVNGMYFCGEVIDVDGFCGGFNLQNCWSTAFVAAEGIVSCIK